MEGGGWEGRGKKLRRGEGTAITCRAAYRSPDPRSRDQRCLSGIRAQISEL